MTPSIPAYHTPTLDEEHLRLLSIFHYVAAGIVALFGCFPIIHVVMGIVFLFTGFPPDAHGQAPPPFLGPMIGLMFVVMGSIFIVGFWTGAVLMFLSGRFIKQRRRHTFSFVVACIECLWMPIGTILGVFTIIVLMRPSVKALFGLPADGGPSPAPRG